MSTVDLTHPSESYIHMSDMPSMAEDSEYTDTSIIDTSRIIRRAHEVDMARIGDPPLPPNNMVSMHSTPLIHRLKVNGDHGTTDLLDGLSQDSSSATLKGETEIDKSSSPLLLSNGHMFTFEEITLMFAPILGKREVINTISKYTMAPPLSPKNKLESSPTHRSQQLALEAIITPPDSHEHIKINNNEQQMLLSETTEYTALMDEIQHLKGHNRILQNHIRDMREQIQELEVDLVKAKNLKGIQDIDSNISIDEFEVEREDTQKQLQLKNEIIASLESKMTNMKHRLETISKTKQELSNENNYLIAKHVGDLDSILSQNKVSPPFQVYYQKLQLDKYDQLTKCQLVNLIKNILLTLPIGDYDHLSSNVELYGKFIKLTSSFLDELHSRLFINQTKPTYYLKKAKNIDLLRKCLECILNQVGNQSKSLSEDS